LEKKEEKGEEKVKVKKLEGELSFYGVEIEDDGIYYRFKVEVAHTDRLLKRIKIEETTSLSGNKAELTNVMLQAILAVMFSQGYILEKSKSLETKEVKT